MNPRNFSLTLTVSALCVACATTSPMTEENYIRFSKFAGASHKCFQAGYLDPKLHADSRSALNTLLSTWNYDAVRMRTLMELEYKEVNATAQSCRVVESNVHQLINTANQYTEGRRTSQKGSYEVPQPTVSKPIWCNRIGSMTMCN